MRGVCWRYRSDPCCIPWAWRRSRALDSWRSLSSSAPSSSTWPGSKTSRSPFRCSCYLLLLFLLLRRTRSFGDGWENPRRERGKDLQISCSSLFPWFRTVGRQTALLREDISSSMFLLCCKKKPSLSLFRFFFFLILLFWFFHSTGNGQRAG